MSGNQLRVRRRDVALAVLTGTVAWALNEYIFFDPAASLVVRLLIVPVFFLVALRSGWRATQLLLFLGFALAYRPRDVHLIAIADRVDYAYFSPNAAGLPGLSTSLTSLLFVTPLAYLYTRGGVRARPLRDYAIVGMALILAWGLTFAAVTGIVRQSVPIGPIITDLKYPLFIIAGFVAVFVSGVSEDIVASFLVKLGLIIAVVTFLNAAMDVTLRHFLLSYNPALFFTIGAFTLVILRGDLRSPTTKVAAVLLALCSFPLGRGEQLVVMLNVILLLGLLLYQPGRSRARRRTALLVAGVAALATAVAGISEISVQTRDFLIRKFELFASLGSTLDKSALVRVAEWGQVTAVHSVSDAVALLFGRGFGGSFNLGGQFGRLALDFSDYGPTELALGQAYQPHLFVTYWILKVGIIGSIALLAIHIRGVTRTSRSQRYLLLSFLLPILWQAYWVPAYAFLTGVLLASTSQRSRDSFHDNPLRELAEIPELPPAAT